MSRKHAKDRSGFGSWLNARTPRTPTVEDTSKTPAERAKIKARRKQKHRK